MKVTRSSSRRRTILVPALISAVFISSTVAEGFVLHQHGVRRAHLHALGRGDLLSNAPSSPKFGHSRSPTRAIRSTSEQVRILAVIRTGSVFVSTSSDSGADADLFGLQNSPNYETVSGHESLVDFTPLVPCPISDRRSTSANILLQTHTLVI